MVLASLGLQITEAEDLLLHTVEWEKSGRFAEAVRRCPEALPAVSFFRHEYMTMNRNEKGRLTTSF
jgi:hypothetical protein